MEIKELFMVRIALEANLTEEKHNELLAEEILMISYNTYEEAKAAGIDMLSRWGEFGARFVIEKHYKLAE